MQCPFDFGLKNITFFEIKSVSNNFLFSLKKRAKLQFVVIEKKAVGLQPLVAV